MGQYELTEAEQTVMDKTAEIANMISEIIAHGPAREGDLAEMVFYVHGLQRMVMSQCAARVHPNRFRLLGGSYPRGPQAPLPSRIGASQFD